jgi:hypothetical protein
MLTSPTTVAEGATKEPKLVGVRLPREAFLIEGCTKKYKIQFKFGTDNIRKLSLSLSLALTSLNVRVGLEEHANFVKALPCSSENTTEGRLEHSLNIQETRNR